MLETGSYQSFSCKLALFSAVLDERIEVLLASVRAAIAAETDNELRTRTAIRAYFEFVDAVPEGCRLIFESDVLDEPSAK